MMDIILQGALDDGLLGKFLSEFHWSSSCAKQCFKSVGILFDNIETTT